MPGSWVAVPSHERLCLAYTAYGPWLIGSACMADPRSARHPRRVPPAGQATRRLAGRRTDGSAPDRKGSARGVPWSRRLGAAIGLYLLFQVKPYYDGTITDPV